MVLLNGVDSVHLDKIDKNNGLMRTDVGVS